MLAQLGHFVTPLRAAKDGDLDLQPILKSRRSFE
jgi:hypothetical protein